MTKLGKAKYLEGYNEISAGAYDRLITYTVPDGKTFYVYILTAQNFSDQVGIAVDLWIPATKTYLIQTGGQQGVACVFPTPIRFDGGETLAVSAKNFSTAAADIYASLVGFEE